VLELAGVVAAQQRELLELRDLASLARTQTLVADQASEHLHKALLASAKVLADLGHPNGNVTMGAVTHKGTLSVQRAASADATAVESRACESSDRTARNVALELRGIASILGGAKLGAKVEGTHAQKRLDELQRRETTSNAESVSGTFEVTYDGLSIKVGS
jgi:hypothetical protein